MTLHIFSGLKQHQESEMQMQNFRHNHADRSKPPTCPHIYANGFHEFTWSSQTAASLVISA